MWLLIFPGGKRGQITLQGTSERWKGGRWPASPGASTHTPARGLDVKLSPEPSAPTWAMLEEHFSVAPLQLYMAMDALDVGLTSPQACLIAMDLPSNHWDVSPPVTVTGPDPARAPLSPEPWDGGLGICLEER